MYSYAEAQAVVQALGIESVKDYRVRYVTATRLPSCPHRVYLNAGWTDWFDFLGKDKPDRYTTYAEAQEAALALGMEDINDYNARYWKDPRLPACPQSSYAGMGWVNWYVFLSKNKSDLYTTYAEAQVAAQALGIGSANNYIACSHQDPRLPASPSAFYASNGWIDWFDFLGKEKPEWYATYAEAQAAAQILGIENSSDYYARYNQDPRLHSNPHRFYINSGWTDWFDFLGKEKPSLYATYAQAKAAVQALDIKYMGEYKERYREDPMLPSNPRATYDNAGWVSNYDFFSRQKPNRYTTYTEAKVAAQALNIQHMGEYRARYREDPRLPADPQRLYANAGWTDNYEFLGQDKINDYSSDYPIVLADVERWLKTQTNITTKRAAIKVLLNGFYQPLKLPDDSKYPLLRSHKFNTTVYTQLIESQAESTQRPYHSAITGFFQWLLDEDCTDEDGDERIVLPDFRNPFVTVLAGFSDSLQNYRPSQSTKFPLGYEYILRARNFLVPNSDASLQTRPTLMDLPHLQDFFNSRTDWIYVDQSQIDRSDSNCIWREVKNADRYRNGNRVVMDSYQIWSPVRFIALYMLLRFPLRGQQILWLDSGEADNEIAILDASGSIRWEKNTGPLAGKGSKKSRPQAVVQKGHKGIPKLYITTNKSGRSEGGYDVEWIPDDLLYWLLLLRDWQAKYNPISKPTEWVDVNLRAETNVKILKARGTQCFLFRTEAVDQVLQTTTAFSHALPALLYRIQRVHEDLATVSEGQKNRFVSSYTPHSLRVSLITAFIADGDAPIHLISKLVGHTSLVMTIYYIRLSGEQMRRPMDEVEKLAAHRSAERSAEAISLGGLHSVRDQLIATDGNRFFIESDVPRTACVVSDCGICPMSGAACYMGGEVVVERKVESLYSPVQAGYLGQKNCPRCRFFITGVPFLGGLVSLANEIGLEISTESNRYQRYTAELDELEQEHYDTCQNGEPFLREMERKQAVSNQHCSAGKLDSLLGDYSALNGHIQSCLKLINQNNLDSDSDVRLIISGDVHEIGVAYEESDTGYHLLAEICQNAAIYKSANASRAAPLISQAIDRMAENNGLPPAMFRLSHEQTIIVANELNRLLLMRLGSWEKIDDLFSGELMLLDIDTHEPELTRISTEIRQLLSSPNSAHQIFQEIPVYE
ncbi:VPA1269 family protein [Pseudomonas sp. UBA2684]|uniref:VPA1269 family protein n=1 Tax=Pseudomonas sp. UBA2684 TaxID=1947311 RepID=UPI0025FCEBDA|nr:VPA1269 family protein [Pseudomonas sp. UBA2684]